MLWRCIAGLLLALATVSAGALAADPEVYPIVAGRFSLSEKFERFWESEGVRASDEVSRSENVEVFQEGTLFWYFVLDYEYGSRLARYGRAFHDRMYIEFHPFVPVMRDRVIDPFPLLTSEGEDRIYPDRIEIHQVVTLRGTSRGIPFIFTATETTILSGSIVLPTAPSIVSQPTSKTAVATSRVELSAGINGSEPLTYRWRRDGVVLPGATSATLTFPSVQVFDAGAYTVEVSNALGSVTSETVNLEVTPAATSMARLLNLSTRGVALSGGAGLIPGFVINGTGSKSLLLRAVGPTLAEFDVPNVLADPVMTLRRRNPGDGTFTIVASSDNWGEDASADAIALATDQLGAFPLPEGSLDAALLLDLSPGQYTIEAGGRDGATGNAIVELYDADPENPATQLINISNRGFVGAGENIMIPGFVVSSEGPRTLLIRAVGPGLATFDVEGALPDPEISIYRRDNATGTDELIVSNDNWSDNPAAATTATIATQVGAFALEPNSKDAALVVTLAPGTYSAIARGVGDATGIALVEVYLVP